MRIAALMPLVLIACTEVEIVEPDGSASLTQCDAEEYSTLIGANISAAVLPSGPTLRAFGENDAVTQDFVPQRTNIVYDSGGVIRRVYCG